MVLLYARQILMTTNTVKVIIAEQTVYKFKVMDYLFKLHMSHKVLIR